MGEIDVPFMRRYIRTFGQIAQIAKVALLNDIKKVVLFNAINFHGFGFIVLQHRIIWPASFSTMVEAG